MDSKDFELAMTRNAHSMQGRIGRYFQWNLGVFPIEKRKRILDLGCGPGLYFNEIMEYRPSLYVAVDSSCAYIERIKMLFGGRHDCKAFRLDLMDPVITRFFEGYNFDYVLLFDVLEHLKDDERVLKNIYITMKSCGAGALFLRVPASQFLYGASDEAIGHCRRYSAKSLKKLLEGCLFKVEVIRYQNFMGMLPWYIIGRVFKRPLAVSSIEGSIFNYMIPAVKFAERIIFPPAGLSLYCICTIKE